MQISVDVKSRIDAAKALLPEAMTLALAAIGEDMEGFAKDDCPVDTGLLRNSITYALSGQKPKIEAYKADRPDKSGTVRTGAYSTTAPQSDSETAIEILLGSNVEYAAAVETRPASHEVGKMHFLRDAIANHIPEYKKKMEQVISAKLS